MTDTAEELRDVICTVRCVLYGSFELAYLIDKDNHRYAFNNKTPGVDLSTVEEGQQYRCSVTKNLGIVRWATRL